MKKTLQKGIYLTVLMLLLLSLIPLQIMAEETIIENQTLPSTIEAGTPVNEGTTLLNTESTLASANVSESVQLNSNDVSIEVTLSATNNLKTDVGKSMIDMNISDYSNITSLKIKASAGIKIGDSDSSFICEKLVNLRKIDLSNIESVSFPESAFRNCKKLEEVVLQDGAIISYKMFNYCTALKSINLSNANPNLGSLAFFGCSSLEEVILPYGAKINDEIFGNCTSLKSIDLSNANPEIGYYAFHDCSNLEQVILPQDTILSGKNTFLNCRLLADINWDAIKSYNGNYNSSGSTDFRNCAFDFSIGYPTKNWDNEIYSYGGQIPKLYFSLAQDSYELNLGESFSIPTPLFKTKNGTDYKNLDTYKTIYSDWLDQNISYLQKTTYNTTIMHDGNVVNFIDTSKPGEYQITYNLLKATYADTHVLSCNITVIDSGDVADQVTGIHLDRTDLTMTLGGEPVLLKATIQPESIINKTVSWSSSDKTIATVDESGRITAIKAGSSTITAMVDGYKAQCQVTVKSSDDSTTKVNVEFTTRYLGDFKVNGLTAERSGSNVIFTLNYESSRDGGYSFFNPPNGDAIMKYAFSGIKIGTNTVELKLTLAEFKQLLANDNITMKFWVDSDASSSWIFFETAQFSSLAAQDELDNLPDEILPTNITVDKSNINLTVGNSGKLTSSLSPSDVTDGTITWSSSNKNIATVDATGNIKGIKAGTSSITATTVNNLSATCEVTVTANNNEKNISYQTHVQNVGWQDLKTNGDMSGTSGESLRLEGIKIQLNNYENLGVAYQTHIQNIGWEADTERGWKSNGVMSGTQGLSYRLEAIQIKLTGSNATNYDIYYQVHAQNVGWMGWAKNGESSGTAGYGYRLEGIRIKVVPKGDPAPSDNVTNTNPFNENIAAPYAPILQEYQVAEANGFSYEVIKNLTNVNKELNLSSYKTKLYYILEDISGDSSPELVIAMYNPKYNNSVHPNDFQIYDVYRLNNGRPERIFDIYTMGYRSIYTICENQIIRCYGSGGVNAHGDTFYKLNGNTATTIQTVSYDNPYYILNDAKNNNRTITKAEADRIINSYIPRTDINWIKL